MSLSMTKLWMNEFTTKDRHGYKHCGLCGNCGVLRSSGIRTPGGEALEPIKTYCICPNGRAMKRGKAII